MLNEKHMGVLHFSWNYCFIALFSGGAGVSPTHLKHTQMKSAFRIILSDFAR